VPFIALDNDPQRIREATRRASGGVRRCRARECAGGGSGAGTRGHRTYADTGSALHIIAHVQESRPGLPVWSRTIDDSDVERLRNAGATEVVADLMEASLMLASSTLMLVGVPLTRVLRRIRETREHAMNCSRVLSRMTATDDSEDQALQPRLHSVLVVAGSKSIGRQLQELDLAEAGVEVTAVSGATSGPRRRPPDMRIERGDVVVLLGSAEAWLGRDQAAAGGSET